MTDDQSPTRGGAHEAPRDALLDGLHQLNDHDELGLDPAEVWARDRARRSRRQVVAGALAVAVAAGGAWGISRGTSGPDEVVAVASGVPSTVSGGPSTHPVPTASSAPATPTGWPTSGPVQASTLAGTTWLGTTAEVAGRYTDLSQYPSRWTFGQPGAGQGLHITEYSAGTVDTRVSWRADGSRIIPGDDRATSIADVAAPTSSPSSSPSERLAYPQQLPSAWTVTGEPTGIVLDDGTTKLHLRPASSASPAPATPSVKAPVTLADLSGTSWRLVAVVRGSGGQGRVDVQQARSTLAVPAGRHVFEVFDGVNDRTASWSESTGAPVVGILADLVLSDVSSGAAGYAGPSTSPVGEAVAAVTAVLAQDHVTVRTAGDELSLVGGTTTLVYRRA